MPRPLLRLSDVAEGESREAEVLCPPATLAARKVECAGVAYREYCRRKLGLTDGASSKENAAADANADVDEDAKLRAAWAAKRKAREEAEGDADEDENLYELLGIGHINFSASEKQIKKAYQQAILIHHPDKLTEAERAEAERAQRDRSAEDPMFLRVQRAWDILSNPEKRRGYDSQFAFDESIPSGNETFADPSEFYDVYGPVFDRNARFSTKKPVPTLGDDATDVARVHRFYMFWTHLDSWRDFSKFDEFKDGDVENAQSRYEKRWMQRSNETIRAKKKKEEVARVRTLVERAMARDPRLLRAREEERLEKERKRREKIERKVAAERQAREAVEAEQRRQEEAARADKERADKERAGRQAAKKAFKKQIRIVRKCCEAAETLVPLDPAAMRELLRALDDVSDHFSDEREVAHLARIFAGASDEGPLDESEPTSDWVEPAGAEAARRGTQALLALHASARAQRADAADEEEAARQRRAAEEAAAEAERKQEAEAAPWSADELSALAKAVRKFPPGSRNRWHTISNYINALPGQTQQREQEDCLKQSRLVAADALDRTQLGSSKTAFDQYQRKLKASDAPAAGAAEDAEAAEGEEADSDVWTAAQQTALEAALKDFPAGMDKNERWKGIAKAVPGKTKKACVARFKELRAKVMSKQQK